MSYQHGQWRLASTTLDTFGADTVATLTVISPSGVETSIPVTPNADKSVWTANAAYQWTAPGEWIERWAVTNTGKTELDTKLQVGPRANAEPTGVRVYATSTDYANSTLTAPPTGIRRMLLEASRDVDKMLLCAIYDVDDDGMPTDADVIIAMREATCAQAEYSKEIGDANAVGGAQYHTMTLGPATLTRAYTAAGSSAPGKYSAKALDILQAAGMNAVGPESW